MPNITDPDFAYESPSQRKRRRRDTTPQIDRAALQRAALEGMITPLDIVARQNRELQHIALNADKYTNMLGETLSDRLFEGQAAELLETEPRVLRVDWGESPPITARVIDESTATSTPEDSTAAPNTQPININGQPYNFPVYGDPTLREGEWTILPRRDQPYGIEINPNNPPLRRIYIRQVIDQLMDKRSIIEQLLDDARRTGILYYRVIAAGSYQSDFVTVEIDPLRNCPTASDLELGEAVYQGGWWTKGAIDLLKIRPAFLQIAQEMGARRDGSLDRWTFIDDPEPNVSPAKITDTTKRNPKSRAALVDFND